MRVLVLVLTVVLMMVVLMLLSMLAPVPLSWLGKDDMLSIMLLFHLSNLELLWSVIVFRGSRVVVYFMILVGGIVWANVCGLWVVLLLEFFLLGVVVGTTRFSFPSCIQPVLIVRLFS